MGGGFGAEAVANFHVITLDLGQMVARNGGRVKGSGRFRFQAYLSEKSFENDIAHTPLWICRSNIREFHRVGAVSAELEMGVGGKR